MNTGSWDIAVQVDKYPQKVASALSNMNETLVGASYEPLAYIGSQVVNGTNHAVLAKQTILSGRDVENIVVLIFNEKPNDMNVVLTRIATVLEGGAEFGDISIEPTELTEELDEMFTKAFEGYVGAAVTPYMILGSQITKGTNYIFAATLSAFVVDMKTIEKAVLVTVNPMTKEVHIVDMLESMYQASLGYAFSW